MHTPYFKYVYNDDIDYITCTVPGHRWIQPYYNKNEFKQIYGYIPECYILDKQKILIEKREYNNLFITYPLVDLIPDRHPNFYQQYGEYLKEIYDFFLPMIKGKIIIIDNHDLPLMVYDILESLDIKVDLIFKKEYNIKAKDLYIKKTYPFPYSVLGMNDCMFILNNKTRIGNANIEKCFWSGSINKNIDSRYFLNYNRELYLQERNDIIYNYSYNGSPSYGNEDYLNMMSNFKFSIYLKGYATLTRRFFEIISTNSLMLMEQHDVIYSVNNDFKIPDECVFNNPEELKEKYNFLIKNENKYNECLQNQLNIREYFSYTYIRNYINKIINSNE